MARLVVRRANVEEEPQLHAGGRVDAGVGHWRDSAIFSFVDAVLLKPLAYQDAERLVSVFDNGRNCQPCPPSPPTFLEWKSLNTVFSHVAGYTDFTQSLNLTGREQAEQLQGRQITANYFEMLGVQPALGRGFRAVDAGYFNTLGLRLVKGRFINERDTAKAQRVVVINQTLADKFFANRDPLGEQVTFAGLQAYTIIGVAADVKYNGLDATTPIEIYVPLAQLEGSWFDSWGRQVTFVARTNNDPRELRTAVRNLAVSVDKDQPIYELKTMDEVVADSTATPRFRTFLFFVFGALAFLKFTLPR